MSSDAFLETYRTHLDLLGVDVADLQTDLGGTIRSRLRGAEPSDLPHLAGFAVGQTLGQGGMGLVSTAWQHSLDREVAVKALRGGRVGDAHRVALVHEARITGQLEHPNVVPIHDLGISPSGEPMFAMKRIDGVAWSDWLAQATAEQQARIAAAGGPLAFHVDVLDQVCNAVSYAHSRGVLHRDLKPANVMIGNFGEVYLVDWGIAARMAEVAEGTREVAGTPAYMAPEMAAGRPLDARSDVYQLGALLFEVVAGHPPRPQGDPIETLAVAWSGEVLPVPDDCPEALAAAIRRALAAKPEDRHGSVAELQTELRNWLRDRSLLELAAASKDRATRAASALGADGEAATVVREARDALAALEPIRSRLDDASLDRLRVSLLSALLDFELRRQRPGTAEAVLHELGTDATSTQRDAVANAIRDEAARAAELARLRDQSDWTHGRAERQWYNLFLGVAQFFVYVPLGLAEQLVLHQPFVFDRVWLPAVGVPSLIGLAVVLGRRDGPAYDTLGSQTMRAMGLMVVGANVLFFCSVALGFDMQTSFFFTLVGGLGLPLAIQAAYTTPRLYPTAGLFALAGFAELLAPRAAMFFIMPTVIAAAHVAFWWADEVDAPAPAPEDGA